MKNLKIKSNIAAIALAIIMIMSIMLFPLVINAGTSTQKTEVTYPVPMWNYLTPYNTFPSPWMQAGNMIQWYNATGTSYNPTSTGPGSSHLIWATQYDVGGIKVDPAIGDNPGNAGFGDSVDESFPEVRGVFAVSAVGIYVTANSRDLRGYNIYTGELLWQTAMTHSMTNMIVRDDNPPIVTICSSNRWVQEFNLLTGELEDSWRMPQEVIFTYDGDAICRSARDGRVSFMYRYTMEEDPELIWGPVPGSYRNTCINDGVLVTMLGTEHFINGIDIETGEQLWETGLSSMSYGSAGYGMYYVGGVDQSFYAFNVHTGELAWKEIVPGSSYWSENYCLVGEGKVSQGNYDGRVHVFDAFTGEKLWEYYGGNCIYENYKTYFGTYPISAGAGPVGAGDRMYAAQGEHSSYEVGQLPGQYMFGWDFTNGELLWKFPCRIGGHNGRGIVADGVLLTVDGYTNKLFAFSKGPTTTTVSTTATQIPVGGYTVITGKVVDESLAQPGTPAVSDASMDAWMAFLHAGMPEPEVGSIIGVDVNLLAISSDEMFEIGTATCDSSGQFAYKWIPPNTEEVYTITASFMGSESYYESWDSATLAVGGI